MGWAPSCEPQSGQPRHHDEIMTSLTNSASRLFHNRAWLVLGAIVAANAIFNLLVSDRNKGQWIQVIVIGIFIAQPVLFATWAAIGPPPAIKRVPFTIAALIVVVMASDIRSQLDHDNENYLEMLCITLALFSASAIVWCIVRISLHWIVANHFAEADVVRGQFSLKYAIGLTTIFALLLGFGRILALGDSSVGRFALTDFVKYAAVPIGLMLLAMFPAVTIPLLILSHPPSSRSIVLIVALWSLMSFFAIQQFAILEVESWTQAAREILGFQIGAIFVGTITAAPLRFAGYRLLTR
jgi:hypothetical protein